MIKKYIRESTKNTFLVILKETLVNSYEVNCDEEGEPTESELMVSDNKICVATEMDFKVVEKELAMYFVDGRIKEQKIEVLFSSEYLADELMSL